MAREYSVKYGRGDCVIILAISEKARITQVCIGAEVTYECVWFANGSRQTAWLNDFEIAAPLSERNKHAAPGFIPGT